MSNNEEKNVVLNFLAGMGLGALVGAATALLLAPKSGEETRQDIKNVTEELKVKADQVVKDLSESSEDLVQRSKELLESAKDKVQSAIETGRSTMAQKKEEIIEEMESAEGEI